MPHRDSRIRNVLVVDDNADDFELIRIAFAANGCDAVLHCASDGRQCMDYLRRQVANAGAGMPDLVVLDINMPEMDGFQVMAEIVADPKLCHLPVIVLTTSDAMHDILRMHRLRCNAYVVKSADFNEFSRAIGVLIDFWNSIARLPEPVPGD